MGNMTIWDALTIMGLSKDFTADDLKKSYRALTRKYHPDFNPDATADEMMTLVNKAHDLLEHLPSNAFKAVTHKSIFDIVEA